MISTEQFFSFCKYRHEPVVLTTELWKLHHYEGPLPQDLSEARQSNEVPLQSSEPPQGRPYGGGGVHRILGYGGISPP